MAINRSLTRFVKPIRTTPNTGVYFVINLYMQPGSRGVTVTKPPLLPQVQVHLHMVTKKHDEPGSAGEVFEINSGHPDTWECHVLDCNRG
tara:strand:- start:6 stop:275 length:270 start_codon:yes stop_codon:yes gene_type:complete